MMGHVNAEIWSGMLGLLPDPVDMGLTQSNNVD